MPQGCRFRAVRCLRFSGRVSLSVRFLHLTGKVAQKYDKANGALVRESGAQTACRWGWGSDFCTYRKIREKDVISRSLERIALYEKLETIKVDVSDISPEQAAELIAEM